MRAAPLVLLLACGGRSAGPAPSTVARVTPPPAPPTLRLPGTIRPTRGALDLTLIPSETTFSGTASYAVTVAAPAPIVWLNATGLTIGSASAEVAGAARTARVVPGGDDFVGLAFDPPLPAGAARLSVVYTGLLDSQRSVGFYRVEEAPGDWYVYSVFEPSDARRAFPGFDEPSAKIPWKLTLHVRAADVALTNAPAAGETPEADARKRVDFEETRPLPSYLVALIVGPFDLVDGGTAGHHGTPLRFAVPRGRGDETRYARAVTPRIVGLLEEYFGMPYPYGKLDVAVVPRYWGTMEHPGLVALGQPLALIRPDEESIERKRDYADIAIHELAHYWFGDYVTTAWWDDTWLNEAAAQWLDAKIADDLEPSWQLVVDRVGDTTGAMGVDSLPSAKRIRQPVSGKDDIANAFDGAITYTKGAAIIRMFEEYLGPERWRDFIRGYLDEHAWGNATADQFLARLGATFGAEIAAGFRGFLERPGVPLVSAKLVCDAGAPPELLLAQTRFRPPGLQTESDAAWSFPVCAHWGAGKASGVSCAFLASARGELVLDRAPRCPDWVMANAGSTGYYRTDYDAALFGPLLGAAGPKLPLIERVRLYADVAALVEAGRMPLATALAAVPGLARESSRYLVESSIAIVRAIRRDLLTPAQRAEAARFLRRTYGARAQSLGFVPQKGESDDARQERPKLLALVGGPGADARLRREAARLAWRWFDDHRAVAPEIAGTVLGLAAIDGDQKLFDRLLAEARRTTDRRERGELLAALGAFRDPALADASLALILGGDLDFRETRGIVAARMEEPETRETAWAWLQANWDAILVKMRADEGMWLYATVETFCDEAHRDAAAVFLAERARATPGAPRTLQNAFDASTVCIAAQKLNGPAIAEFLARY